MLFKLLNIFLHPGDSVTFDNIGGSNPDQSSEGEGDPDPGDPDEGDPDNSGGDPDGDGGTSSDDDGDPDEGDPDEGDPKEGDPEEVLDALMFGKDKYELKKLLGDKEALGKFQKLINDGVLMRSDYTQKTQETAELKKQMTGYKEDLDTKYESGVTRVKDLLEQTNQTLTETPLEFLRQTFTHDQSGQQRSPEEIEQQVGNWIKTLTRHVQDGSSYDPAAIRRQSEMDRRMRTLEDRDNASKQKADRERDDSAIKTVKAQIGSKIEDSIKKFGMTKDVLKEFPDYGEFLRGKLVKAFSASFQEAYAKADDSWNDESFINNFDFEAAVKSDVQKLESFLDKKYGKYLKKKRTDKNEKTAVDGSSGKKSSGKNEPEGGWTFNNM